MTATTDTDNDPTDRRTVSELLAMDEATARETLTVQEYQRWESLTDAHERADEVRAEFDAADEAVNRLLVANDFSALTQTVDVFGNELEVYYDPEDKAVRAAAERLADIFDADPRNPDAEITTADVSDEQLAAAKDGLADLLFEAVVTWRGTDFEEVSAAERESLKQTITQPHPDGWGLAGLFDAWATVMYAVESNRNERMERVQKFRNASRRGDR